MATRTISIAGGNWNSTGTWDEGVVPVAGDDVVVRAAGNSGNVTVTATAACATINLTAGAYNGTFTINSSVTLTVTSNITLNSSGTCTGISAGSPTTSILSITDNMSLNTNGKTLACAVTFTTAGKILTLASDVNHTGLLQISNATTATQFSGSFTWTTSGGVSQASGSHTVNTGCKLKITGGTWTGSGTANRFVQGAGTLEIAGNITITTAMQISGLLLLYTSGTISGQGPHFYGATNTLNGGGTYPAINIAATTTLTLNAGITVTGTFGINNTVSLTMAGGQTVSCGILSFSGGTQSVTRDAVWSATTIQISTTNATTASILGAFDMSVTNLYVLGRTNTTSFSFKSGQILTVTGTLQVAGSNAVTTTVSGSGGSFTLALSGATVQSFYATYTSVAVTGQTLYNYHGQTLTSTSGITNFTTTPADSSDPGVGNVRLSTSYKINGSNLSGTYQNPRSSGFMG